MTASACLGVTFLPQSGGTAQGQRDLIPDPSFEGKIALGSFWRGLKGKNVFKKECFSLPARKPSEEDEFTLVFLPEHGWAAAVDPLARTRLEEFLGGCFHCRP